MNPSKLFKGFTPYRQLGTAVMPTHETLSKFPITEPHSTSWSSSGFAEVMDEELVLDVQGGGTLAMFQVNERILPGSVIREKIVERVKDIQERDGRKVGKKQFAEIRDDVTMQLLPGAFIRRKYIPVLFRNDLIFIFTGSAKLCDSVASSLVLSMDEGFSLSHVGALVEASVGGALTTLAKEEIVGSDDDCFWTSNSLVLSGGDKQMIRIKDKGVGSHDVQELLKQDYQVKQLGLTFGVDDGGSTSIEEAEFVLSDKFIFTGMKLIDVKTEHSNDSKDASDILMSTAWLTATMASRIVALAVEMCGGYRDTVAPSKPAVDVSDL